MIKFHIILLLKTGYSNYKAPTTKKSPSKASLNSAEENKIIDELDAIAASEALSNYSGSNEATPNNSFQSSGIYPYNKLTGCLSVCTDGSR